MLKFTTGKGKVTFAYTDDNMMAAFEIKQEDPEEKLMSALRRIVAFVEAQEGKEALPERIPGMALGMAQEQYPAAPEAPVNGVPSNGWAVWAMPEIPEHAKGEWELNTPEGEG